MSSAQVAFVVPRRVDALATEIFAGAGVSPNLPKDIPQALLTSVLSGLVGERIDVTFAGARAAVCADLLCQALSEAHGKFLCVTGARLDPSMCWPVPARVFGSALALDDGLDHAVLPMGFKDAALDVRTLKAAGVPFPQAVLMTVLPGLRSLNVEQAVEGSLA